jgi:hypothetical protein
VDVLSEAQPANIAFFVSGGAVGRHLFWAILRRIGRLRRAKMRSSVTSAARPVTIRTLD